MRIRRATDDDLDPVWAGIVADDLNPQRDGEWFVAMAGEEVVGALHIVRVGPDDLLDDLWVRPQRRGAGIGGALARHAQGLCDALWLIADPDGVAFYEKLGFIMERPLPTAIAGRYRALGLWPGHLDHLHVPMRWRRRDA